MAKPRLIVVGIDYSEQSALALRRALELAAGGELHTLHVVEAVAELSPPLGAAVTPMVSLAEAEANLVRYVDDQLSQLELDALPHRMATHVAVGHAAEVIVQLASDLEADFIVVGTHGRKGFERFLLGSIAERVVRRATCPVVVERAKASVPEAPAIEPPCPRCVEARRASEGRDLWCAQHSERHGRRHTYRVREGLRAFPSPHGGLGSIS